MISQRQPVDELLGRRARLLVVDDEPLNVRIIHQLFADEYEIFMATSAEQALQVCAKVVPDIILLDVVMPSVTGLELCRQLKSEHTTASIPVLFVTGNEGPNEEDACWEAGGVDFVPKPVNRRTLRNRVQAHLTLKLQADRLRQLAFIDGLTGIANRRQFDERAAAELSRCARSHTPLVVQLVDVDFFKRYNDRFGHQAGDECLRKVAAALLTGVYRPSDMVARYGGEEFVVLLPETDPIGAKRVGARLVQRVRELGIAHGASDAAEVVTVSVGSAILRPGTAHRVQDLLSSADAQLYRAKREGRNRFCDGDDSAAL